MCCWRPFNVHLAAFWYVFYCHHSLSARVQKRGMCAAHLHQVAQAWALGV